MRTIDLDKMLEDRGYDLDQIGEVHVVFAGRNVRVHRVLRTGKIVDDHLQGKRPGVELVPVINLDDYEMYEELRNETEGVMVKFGGKTRATIFRDPSRPVIDGEPPKGYVAEAVEDIIQKHIRGARNIE